MVGARECRDAKLERQVHGLWTVRDGQPGVAHYECVRVPQPGQSARQLRVQEAATSHRVSITSAVPRC